MKSTFATLFYIDKSKTNKEGLCSIRCRISCNGKNSSFSTQLQVSPDHWSATKNRVLSVAKNATALNHRLHCIEGDLRAIYEETLKRENYITAGYIKERYLLQSKPTPTLLELYQALCNQKSTQKGKPLASETIRAFKDSWRSFERFLTHKQLQAAMPSDLDKESIEEYRSYMLKEMGNKPSSVSVRLRHLHQVVRQAIMEQYIREDPFVLIDIETPTYERNALISDDLKLLLGHRPNRSTHNHIRLIFLLGCFTGLAFSDLKKLRIEDIQPLKDGRKYIILYRTKTENRCIIPILPIAQEIIDFYVGEREEGLIFKEFPVNSYFNRLIHQIIAEVGIKTTERITSHTARHTFATTICLENGLPMETVSKILGHRFISTTEIYAKVTKQKIAKEMKPLLGSQQTKSMRKALQVCPKRKPPKRQSNGIAKSQMP